MGNGSVEQNKTQKQDRPGFFFQLRTILLLLVLCAMLPAIGLAFYVGLQQRAAGKAGVTQEAFWAARSVTRRLEGITDSTHRLLMALGTNTVIRHVEQPKCDLLLRQVMEEQGIYQTLLVADARGDCVANALPQPARLNISDRPYFQQAVQSGSFQIGKFAVSRTTGQPTLHFALPISGADGRPEFVIIAALRLNIIETYQEEKHLPKGATLAISDRSGVVLYCYPADLNLLGNPLPKDQWEKMTSISEVESSFNTIGENGQECIFACHRIDLTGQKGDLYITVGIPAELAFAEANHTLARQLTALVLLCAGALAAAWLIGSRLILRRVHWLTTTARQLARGNLKARVDITGMEGEIGQLARSFNEMAEALYIREGDRKAAVEALLESEERFRDLVENTTDWIWEIDTNGRYVYASPQIQSILGYSPEEIIGKTPFDLMDEAEANRLRPTVTNIMARQEHIQTLENVCRHKDGHLVVLETKAIPVFQEDGKLVGFRGIDRDITERKRAQDSERENEEKFRLFIENFPGLVYVKDSSLHNTLMSKMFEKVVNRPVEELLGETIMGSFPEISNDFGRDDLAVLNLDFGEFVVSEENFRCRTYQTYKFPVDFKGQKMIGGLALDITERKRVEEERRRLEAQVQHVQKLESLGVLAGGIAHDFNNLLMAILGNLDLALAELSPVSPVREDLKEAEKASLRAAELCKQMLAYSGKGRFVIQSLDLGEVVEEVAHMLRVSISKKAALRFNFATGLPPVEADPTEIRQVIMNLVINASDAIGDQDGFISVSTGVMECNRAYLATTYLDENLAEGAYVYLEVADTGCGMDPETLSKIFDPFFTTKFAGRGLGLAAVLGIVRGHKGAITVNSQKGRGTTFRILFPASLRPVEKLAGESGQARTWRGSGTVLLVDDEEAVRGLAGKMLERLGFSVLTAADGWEALEVFRNNQAEINSIILDLTMPHMDGEETFQELRKIKSDIPVVMSSGYSEQEINQRFAGKGLAGFIQKPYQLATLSEILRIILQGS